MCIALFTTLTTNQYTQAQVQPQFVPNQLIVTTATPMLWDKKAQTVEELTTVFPVGSKVTDCADMCLQTQSPELVAQGKYRGTQFLVELPANNAQTVLEENEGTIRKVQPLISNLWLNNLGFTQASPPSMIQTS